MYTISSTAGDRDYIFYTGAAGYEAMQRAMTGYAPGYLTGITVKNPNFSLWDKEGFLDKKYHSIEEIEELENEETIKNL